MKKLLKIFALFIVVVAVVAIVGSQFGLFDRGPSTKEVQTQQAELRTITQLVSASGRIQPEVQVIIRPDVSGEIIELNVKEGDFVREGDLLLRIKPDLYQAQIDNLQATLFSQMARMEQARANKLQAEVEYIKNKELFERNVISQLAYLQSKNNYEAQVANFRASEFQIESARAQLRRAEEELQQTVIRSPKDGTITRLAVERGERVLGQSQMTGTEMMRIARLEQMEILVDVNENDIVNVSLADTALIQVDAYPGRSFKGMVTEIANSADITGTGSAEQVTNYKVKVRILTPHNLSNRSGQITLVSTGEVETQESVMFRPGMSGTVDIQTRTVQNSVSVPIQAVTVRDFAKDKSVETDTTVTTSVGKVQEDFRRVVFVNEDGVAKRFEVQTGISDNNFIQIISGINEGAEVITGSFRILSRELNDGDLITVKN
jgi:HlyD family secretion protein